jgi:hypothetical protein
LNTINENQEWGYFYEFTPVFLLHAGKIHLSFSFIYESKPMFKFEVITAVTVKFAAFLDVTPYSPVVVC